jgi:hypothetical protein
MKLSITARSERGKDLIKSANEYIYIDICNQDRHIIYSVEVENRDDEISLTVNNLITGEKDIMSVPHE